MGWLLVLHMEYNILLEVWCQGGFTNYYWAIVEWWTEQETSDTWHEQFECIWLVYLFSFYRYQNEPKEIIRPSLIRGKCLFFLETGASSIASHLIATSTPPPTHYKKKQKTNKTTTKQSKCWPVSTENFMCVLKPSHFWILIPFNPKPLYIWWASESWCNCGTEEVGIDNSTSTLCSKYVMQNGQSEGHLPI